MNREDVMKVVAEAREKGVQPDLRGSNLRGSNLEGTNLWCAYLDYANLRGAYLRGAYLDCADLRGANLDCADLTGAYLRGADLRGAYLECANLRGANLMAAIGIGRISNIGSRGDDLYYVLHDTSVMIATGCFWDTLDSFASAVTQKHGDNQSGQMYKAAIEFIRVWERQREAKAVYSPAQRMLRLTTQIDDPDPTVTPGRMGKDKPAARVDAVTDERD